MSWGSRLDHELDLMRNLLSYRWAMRNPPWREVSCAAAVGKAEVATVDMFAADVVLLRARAMAG